MTNVLTERETQVYNYIVAYIEEHSYSPVYSEIAKHFGWKVRAGAHQVVERLVQKGFLRKGKGTIRSIQIAHPVTSTLVRANFDELNFIEFHRSLFKDDARNIELLKWDDLILVVSLLPPKIRDLCVMESRMLKIHALGAFTGNGLLTLEGKFYGADASILRRVILVLQPKPTAL